MITCDNILVGNMEKESVYLGPKVLLPYFLLYVLFQEIKMMSFQMIRLFKGKTTCRLITPYESIWMGEYFDFSMMKELHHRIYKGPILEGNVVKIYVALITI
jgi:hypothetical protein